VTFNQALSQISRAIFCLDPFNPERPRDDVVPRPAHSLDICLHL